MHSQIKRILRVGVSTCILCQIGFPRERFWNWVLNLVGPHLLHVAAIPIVNVVWSYTLIGLVEILYRLEIPWIEQHRSTPGVPWPWKHPDPNVRKNYTALQWKTFKTTSIQMFLLTTIAIALRWRTEPNMDMLSPDKIPSQFIVGLQLMFLYITFSFYFYWSHRAFHHFPDLYKFHKRHHEYTQVTVMSATNLHVVEGLAHGIALVLLSRLIGAHLYVQIMYTLLVHLDGDVHDHSGYEIELWILPFDIGTSAADHDVHHRTNGDCNYGTKVNWDKLFGTYVKSAKYE